MLLKTKSQRPVLQPSLQPARQTRHLVSPERVTATGAQATACIIAVACLQFTLTDTQRIIAGHTASACNCHMKLLLCRHLVHARLDELHGAA